MSLPETAIRPFVGALVWYRPCGHSERRANQDCAVAPAIVTAVYADDAAHGGVSLKVLYNGHSGKYLPLVHYGTEPGYWCWPDRVE